MDIQYPWQVGPWPGSSDTPVEVELRAAAPGDLAQLDAWRITWEPVRGESGSTVAALVTRGDLTRLRQDLMRTFHRFGLWPLSTEGLRGNVSRPWLEQELFDHQDVPTGDVLELLQRQLDDDDPDPEDENRLELPALAAPTTSGTRHPVPGSGPEPGFALLVVPVTRPADAPAVLGWGGAINYDLSGADISLVLRSWEERYGAVLVDLGFDTVQLDVAAPPQDSDQVQAVAVEHHALAPDNTNQGVGTMEEYLPAVRDTRWFFWWD